MNATIELLRRPRVKRFGLGVVAALLLGGYALYLPQSQTTTSHVSGGSSELMMAAPAMADQGMSASPVMAKSAARMAVAEDLSAASGDPGNRRVEETHHFSLTGERDRIPEHYEAAMEACGPSFCEILSGSLNDYGGTLQAQVSVRVDPQMFDALIKGAGVGSENLTLVSHQRSAQDRTRQYEDVAARLQSQKALHDRLMALLDSPTTRKTSDILEIEREIARTQGQIESLDAQRRSIETVTDRTTVHFSFRNDRLESAPSHPPYLANALKEAGTIFERSLAQVVKLAAGFSPILIVAGLLWGIIFRLIPAVRRRIKPRD
jgi:hypothetical protein